MILAGRRFRGRTQDRPIGHRQREIFGESAGAVHADAAGVRAKMTPAGEAITAAPADHVAFAADNFPRVEIVYVRPNGNNLAYKLVPHRHRHRNGLPRPLIPLINVQIGSANSGFPDSYQDIVDSDCWLGYIRQP